MGSFMVSTVTQTPTTAPKNTHLGAAKAAKNDEFYTMWADIERSAAIDADVNELRAEPAVLNNKGIYEYLLGGKTDPRLLNVRVFDQKTKVAAYEQQTQKATEAGISNCPLCAIGEERHNTRIYKLDEMDADHVTAWSKGGDTDLSNCRCSASPTTEPRGTGSHARGGAACVRANGDSEAA